MRREGRQVWVEWISYYVGEFVRRTSRDSDLPDDGVYQVISVDPPQGNDPDAQPRLFVIPAGAGPVSVIDLIDHVTKCDDKGWREALDTGPWDGDYPPGDPEDSPRLSRRDYEANRMQWPKKGVDET